jgi:hypothetical protein
MASSRRLMDWAPEFLPSGKAIEPRFGAARLNV